MHVDVAAADDDAALRALVTVPGYRAKIERIFTMRLEAFDWNCPPRFAEAEIADAVRPLRERIAALEAENAAPRDPAVPPSNIQGERR